METPISTSPWTFRLGLPLKIKQESCDKYSKKGSKWEWLCKKPAKNSTVRTRDLRN